MNRNVRLLLVIIAAVVVTVVAFRIWGDDDKNRLRMESEIGRDLDKRRDK